MKYDWRKAGEEWSQPWGGSAAQWSGTIFPRIRDCLPVGTILEIAPGFGRWTHYLKDFCNQLWVVDKSSECIKACRQRFAADSHVRCYLNDGRSLPMLPDASVDFVFSFDSFVHPDRDVVEGYLRQLRTKLKIGGKGFIHHSNFGEYANSTRERLPELLTKPLMPKSGVNTPCRKRQNSSCPKLAAVAARSVGTASRKAAGTITRLRPNRSD